MKTKASKQIVLNCILSIMFLSLMACSSDDDTGGNPANDMVSFRVDLIKLTGVDTSTDGGDELEVYGTIKASYNLGSVSDQQTLWEREQTNYVSVDESDIPITGSTTFTLNMSDMDNSTIAVNAHLTEYDSSANNSDDPIGNETATIALNSVASTVTYELLLDDTDGHEVKLTYSITRL